MYGMVPHAVVSLRLVGSEDSIDVVQYCTSYPLAARAKGVEPCDLTGVVLLARGGHESTLLSVAPCDEEQGTCLGGYDDGTVTAVAVANAADRAFTYTVITNNDK